MDWNGQCQRVKRDPILSEGMCVMHIPFGRGGNQVSVSSATFCDKVRACARGIVGRLTMQARTANDALENRKAARQGLPVTDFWDQYAHAHAHAREYPDDPT